MSAGSAPDPRAIIAMLANPATRAVFARIASGAPAGELSRREETALTQLRDAGLVVGDAVNEEGLRRTLAALAAPPARGVDRFLRDGRIDRFPVGPDDRRELLEWVAERVLAPGDRIGEAELTERLDAFADDRVLLRRYLVDYGVLDRAADGSWYARAE